MIKMRVKPLRPDDYHYNADEEERHMDAMRESYLNDFLGHGFVRVRFHELTICDLFEVPEIEQGVMHILRRASQGKNVQAEAEKVGRLVADKVDAWIEERL